MQKSWILSGAALLCGALGVGAVADKVVPKPAQKANTQTETGAKADSILIDRVPAGPPVSEAQSADEEAIRLTDEAFVKAYGEGNASSVAAHFTSDAEYVDELGDVFQGRKAIEESLSAFFAENPGVRLELSIDSIRFLCPGVAVEDGTATIIRNEDEPGIGSFLHHGACENRRQVDGRQRS